LKRSRQAVDNVTSVPELTLSTALLLLRFFKKENDLPVYERGLAKQCTWAALFRFE